MTKEELGKLYPGNLQPYNPDWAALFKKEKQFLISILNSFGLRIEHVGSTAIPAVCRIHGTVHAVEHHIRRAIVEGLRCVCSWLVR
jgi:hypothetical protein